MGRHEVPAHPTDVNIMTGNQMCMRVVILRTSGVCLTIVESVRHLLLGVWLRLLLLKVERRLTGVTEASS